MEMHNQISVFEQKQIRQTQHNGETFFSIVDIIEVLADTPRPTAYWNKVQKSLISESQVYPFWIKLKIKAADGKFYKSDCANTEGVLRIIQSVPSPKAEPFKLWLADLGKQAIAEVNDPELMSARQAEIYRAKGYPEDWIAQRIQTIDTRRELTDEWKKRGVTEGSEYSVLTATIAKGTFGLTPSEHSKAKGLEKENLRDHMTRIELIFTALGEESTRMMAADKDAQGFHENLDFAQKGGEVAGDARERFEMKTGLKVVSETNFLEADKTKASQLPTGNEKTSE